MMTAVPSTRVPATTDKQNLGALLDALNVDIDRAGTVSRRAGWAESSATPAHSLFEHAGVTYAAVGGQVGRLDGESFTPLGAAVGPLSWTVLNDDPVFATYDGVFVVRDGAVQALPTGSDNDGEAELLLMPLPGGQFVGYWQGRLVVARGCSLFFSEPLRYGVYSPLSGYVLFEERVSWVAPTAGGLYVGLRESVRFLRGTEPGEFQQTRVGGATWRGAGAVVKTAGMDPSVAQGAAEVAVWLCDRGFAVGHPSGQVIYPQATHLKDLPLGAGRLVVLGDRITVTSN